ncbi:MAG: hypothetical protein ACRCXZ_07080 [Patescibacteria group bacterium]
MFLTGTLVITLEPTPQEIESENQNSLLRQSILDDFQRVSKRIQSIAKANNEDQNYLTQYHLDNLTDQVENLLIDLIPPSAPLRIQFCDSIYQTVVLKDSSGNWTKSYEMDIEDINTLQTAFQEHIARILNGIQRPIRTTIIELKNEGEFTIDEFLKFVFEGS